MPGTGLKTAPFQCQGKKGGVNEGLGEGAYGRAGERGWGEWGSGEGRLAATVSAEETAETDLETKLRQACSEHGFSPHKWGTISNKYVTMFWSYNCSFLFWPGSVFLKRWGASFFLVLSKMGGKVVGEITRDGGGSSKQLPPVPFWKIPECSRRCEMMFFTVFLPVTSYIISPPPHKVSRKVEQWWQNSEQAKWHKKPLLLISG